jgi:hypothetical protein
VVKDTTGSYTGGLLLLSAVGTLSMLIVLALSHDHELERPTFTVGEPLSSNG